MASYSLVSSIADQFRATSLNLSLAYNPAAEAFKSFDQDQSSTLLSSLHLDAEDEPRRGASRANSVRFDESALHGHFSRTSADFLPSRTGSALGGAALALNERTSSHKSDGRHSSAGQSVTSARASTYGAESRPLSATVPSFVPSGPSAGLFILGPVPSIIRCWLTTSFSNDSLLYAAICTGSCRSILGTEIIHRLELQDQIKTGQEGRKTLKLPVYLPEATIQQSSSRSSSPVPQLPTLTVDFDVHDLSSKGDQIQILVGSDLLRARSADIQFSLDRVTLFDDDRNKLSIPLVRPENAKLFETLLTSHARGQNHDRSLTVSVEDGAMTASGELSNPDKSKTEQEPPTNGSIKPVVSSANGVGRKSISNSEAGDIGSSTSLEEIKPSTEAGTEKTPTKSTEAGSIWGSWRRDPTQSNGQSLASRDTTNSSGYQRAGRGRGMKILKPARLNTAQSTASTQAPIGMDTISRTAGPENKVIAPPSASKPKSGNPIGGASAFGWLNSAAGQSSKPPSSTEDS